MNNSSSNADFTSDDMHALCSSCDRCRARKTKCDSQRPCGNCATKYMKKHKLTSLDGVPMEAIECIYSPAKRRGPVPGKTTSSTGQQQSTGQHRKPSELDGSNNNINNMIQFNSEQLHHDAAGASDYLASQLQGSSGGDNSNALMSWQLQLQQQQMQQAAATGYLQQQQQQSYNVGGAATASLMEQHSSNSSMNLNQQQQGGANLSQQQQQPYGGMTNRSVLDNLMEAASRRMQQHQQHPSNVGSSSNHHSSSQQHHAPQSSGGGSAQIPRTISNHTHLLEPNDPDGSRLYAYYRLSIDEIFRLPPTVRAQDLAISSEHNGNSSNNDLMSNMSNNPGLAALSAAQFAELALGALVHNEVAWAMELCNAVVHCLRDSCSSSNNNVSSGGGDHGAAGAMHNSPLVQFEVTRAYFLLGVFRACRGDMVRYFKYRTVCMVYLSKMEPDDKTTILMAAISFLDSWAYMVYNGNEKDLPEGCAAGHRGMIHSDSMSNVNKYGIDTNIQAIARDPRNRNWVQGAPPVYLNNEAPLHARSLDAVACAIRNCCDQANTRFASIAKEAAGGGHVDPSQQHRVPMEPGEQDLHSLTSAAVMSHESELCSRNIILSAYTLMQQHDALNKGRHKYDGLHMVISVMDAFLENSDDDLQGGFTDSQIQSLLSVCNTTLENPLLLHHAGPTYHMVTNAAVLLCHLLNGMHVMQSEEHQSADGSAASTSSGSSSSMEQSLFEEVLDTFLPIRKLLTIHRRKLPVKLRCHGIPRPNFRFKKGEPLVDLSETLLCPCRGCQGFVLMACSPCVAAERARAATTRVEVEEAQEIEAMQLGEVDKEIDDLGAEFDLDDDALLGMIGNLISN
ncbi:hypothetical protein MPSEU_000669800 [Mayamaea pseudoterrestris]|nr:hypothetical protein MPSEU_000669800 [Mayamaea pseudoterrestris]